jgi:ATP:corrinoid adenosyltransferase
VTQQLGLLVTDASPLITLAAAEALECLTMPGLRVVIPDMVYFEVTQDLAKTGAEDIVQWARRHQGQVEIVVTSVFAEFQVVRAADPRTRSKG